MENAMELPMLTKVFVLICLVIFFGLVCTWGVIWPWLVGRARYLGKLALARRRYLVTVAMTSLRYLHALSEKTEKHMFGQTGRPKTL